MKKHILILFLAAFLFSCSDNESSSVNDSLIIGKWQNDLDPGYGDAEFYQNGRVKFDYFDENLGDDFEEWGDYQINGNNIKIFWDEPEEPGDFYDANITTLNSEKLIWKTLIDGELTDESFTRIE